MFIDNKNYKLLLIIPCIIKNMAKLKYFFLNFGIDQDLSDVNQEIRV